MVKKEKKMISKKVLVLFRSSKQEQDNETIVYAERTFEKLTHRLSKLCVCLYLKSTNSQLIQQLEASTILIAQFEERTCR